MSERSTSPHPGSRLWARKERDRSRTPPPQPARSNRPAAEPKVVEFWNHAKEETKEADPAKDESKQENETRVNPKENAVKQTFFWRRVTTTDTNKDSKKAQPRAQPSPSHADLRVENEMLREQVRALQLTLQQQETYRTSRELNLLEDGLLSASTHTAAGAEGTKHEVRRRRRWSEDGVNEEEQRPENNESGGTGSGETDSSSTVTNDKVPQKGDDDQSSPKSEEETGKGRSLREKVNYEKTIKLSMELAESRSEIDQLKHKLAMAEQKIMNLTEQLAGGPPSSSPDSKLLATVPTRTAPAMKLWSRSAPAAPAPSAPVARKAAATSKTSSWWGRSAPSDEADGEEQEPTDIRGLTHMKE